MTLPLGTLERIGPGLVRIWTRDRWDYQRFCFAPEHPLWTSLPSPALEQVSQCPHCAIRRAEQHAVARSQALSVQAMAQGVEL
jgi:hypothetical protein